MPQRIFFWCTNVSWKFSVLPDPVCAHTCIFDQIRSYFFGEHERVLVDTRGFSPLVHLTKVPALCKPITELDRLSHVVCCVDKSCQIFPLGSYKKNTNGEVQPNEAFAGLGLDKNFCLSSYALLRPVTQEDKVMQGARKADVFTHDFLDRLCDECPKNSWSVLKDTTQTVALLRNRMWPGFVGFSRANSLAHGAVYIGDGLKNPDLPFQI